MNLFSPQNLQNLDNPFIIAELSGNHNQSLNRALNMVEEAAKAGANAIKLQTYTADTMTLNIKKGEFFIKDKDNLWKGETLYSLYSKAHTPWDWHLPIFKKASELGIIAFSTPFDISSVEFLESIGNPIYKISSFENIHQPLLERVTKTNKPIIISTGMAKLSELSETVDFVRFHGCKDLTLLKCTSSYPASANQSNISTIPYLKNIFNCNVGLSDHTLGIGVAIASISLGAKVIEKHFTLSRKDGGVDSAFSLEPNELCNLVKESKRASESIGNVTFGATGKEIKSIKRRRSLYIVKDLQKGDIISEKNIKAIRPGLGLSPKYFNIVLGMKLTKNIEKGTPLTWDLFKNKP